MNRVEGPNNFRANGVSRRSSTFEDEAHIGYSRNGNGAGIEIAVKPAAGDRDRSPEEKQRQFAEQLRKKIETYDFQPIIDIICRELGEGFITRGESAVSIALASLLAHPRSIFNLRMIALNTAIPENIKLGYLGFLYGAAQRVKLNWENLKYIADYDYSAGTLLYTKLRDAVRQLTQRLMKKDAYDAHEVNLPPVINKFFSYYVHTGSAHAQLLALSSNVYQNPVNFREQVLDFNNHRLEQKHQQEEEARQQWKQGLQQRVGR